MDSTIPLDLLLARTRAEADQSHGVRVLWVSEDRRPPAVHLPGAAWWSSPEADPPPPAFLGARDEEVWVASVEAERSAAVAAKLRCMGYVARALRGSLPPDLLVPGPPVAALWAPDPYLQTHAHHLLRGGGWVLDLGCGSGRDAVFLAQAGARVCGVDHLPDALELAGARARHHCVSVEWVCQRIRGAQDLPALEVGAVVSIRFTTISWWEGLHRRVPSGTLFLLRAFGPPSADRPGPRRPSQRLDSDLAHRLLGGHWEFEDGPRETIDARGSWLEFLARRR